MSPKDRAIAQRLVTGQVDLLRFEAGQRVRVLGLLDRLGEELRAKVLNAKTEWARQRADAILKQVQGTVANYYSQISKSTVQELATVAKLQHQGTLLATQLSGSLPTEKHLKALVSDALVDGTTVKEWWAKQAGETAHKAQQAIRQGAVAGETREQIAKRLVGAPGEPGVLDISKRQAQTLVHTSLQAVANEARLDSFRQHADVIKGVRQVSTLDNVTSPTCIAYADGEWDLDGEPINGTQLPFNGGPPRHWNCRSTLVPIVDIEGALGLDVDGTPASKAALGSQVPGSLTFEEWLATRTVAEQDIQLGAGRAQLWRDGQITLKQLLDLKGNPLSLAQLEAKYGGAAEVMASGKRVDEAVTLMGKNPLPAEVVAARAAKIESVETELKALGMSDIKVTYHVGKGDAIAQLGDEWTTGAYFRPQTAKHVSGSGVVVKSGGEIGIYLDSYKSLNISGTVRHEAFHARFHYARTKSATIDTFIDKNTLALIKEDGTTTYSRAYWAKYQDAIAKGGTGHLELRTAVNESLAEMHKMRAMLPTYKKLDDLVEKKWATRKAAVDKDEPGTVFTQKPPVLAAPADGGAPGGGTWYQVLEKKQMEEVTQKYLAQGKLAIEAEKLAAKDIADKYAAMTPAEIKKAKGLASLKLWTEKKKAEITKQKAEGTYVSPVKSPKQVKVNAVQDWLKSEGGKYWVEVKGGRPGMLLDQNPEVIQALMKNIDDQIKVIAKNTAELTAKQTMLDEFMLTPAAEQLQAFFTPAAINELAASKTMGELKQLLEITKINHAASLASKAAFAAEQAQFAAIQAQANAGDFDALKLLVKKSYDTDVPPGYVFTGIDALKEKFPMNSGDNLPLLVKKDIDLFLAPKFTKAQAWLNDNEGKDYIETVAGSSPDFPTVSALEKMDDKEFDAWLTPHKAFKANVDVDDPLLELEEANPYEWISSDKGKEWAKTNGIVGQKYHNLVDAFEFEEVDDWFEFAAKYIHGGASLADSDFKHLISDVLQPNPAAAIAAKTVGVTPTGLPGMSAYKWSKSDAGKKWMQDHPEAAVKSITQWGQAQFDKWYQKNVSHTVFEFNEGAAPSIKTAAQATVTPGGIFVTPQAAGVPLDLFIAAQAHSKAKYGYDVQIPKGYKFTSAAQLQSKYHGQPLAAALWKDLNQAYHSLNSNLQAQHQAAKAAAEKAKWDALSKTKLPKPSDHGGYRAFTPSEYAALEQRFSRAFSDASGTYTPGERSTMRSYTGSSYQSWNAALREEARTGKATRLDAETRKKLAAMEDALYKSGLEEDRLLFRGVHSDVAGAYWKQIEEGGIDKLVGVTIEDAGFASTSVSEDFSRRWAGSRGMLIEIMAPRGTSGAYVQAISNHKSEKEWLLPPGTRMVIEHAEIQQGNYGGPVLKVIVRLVPPLKRRR